MSMFVWHAYYIKRVKTPWILRIYIKKLPTFVYSLIIEESGGGGVVRGNTVKAPVSVMFFQVLKL